MTTELDFNGGNNACLSLRVLAEKLRQGEIQIVMAETREHGKYLALALTHPKRGDDFKLLGKSSG